MSRATRLRRQAAAEQPLAAVLPIAPEPVIVAAAQECAKPVRGGYPCPECLNPITRVIRTLTRAGGLARVRRCPNCTATIRTTETHIVGAAYAQKRISIGDVLRLSEKQIPDSPETPKDKSEDTR